MIFALEEGGRPLVLFSPKDDAHLELYPPSEWAQIQKRTEQKARMEKKPHLNRLLNARAHLVPLENQGNGRILIPQPWVDYFKPDLEVIFLGNTRKIELWSQKDYESTVAVHQTDFEEELSDLLE